MLILLLVLRYLPQWVWIIVSNPMYLAAWIIFSLGPLFFVLHKTKHLKVSPELAKRYDAFARTDMDRRINYRFYLIYMVSFILRYIVAWIAILTYCSLLMIIMIGANDDTPLETWRYNLVSLTIKPFVRLHMWVSGVIKVNYQERKDICYKQYLGDDWKPEFKGAGIQISNH